MLRPAPEPIPAGGREAVPTRWHHREPIPAGGREAVPTRRRRQEPIPARGRRMGPTRCCRPVQRDRTDPADPNIPSPTARPAASPTGAQGHPRLLRSLRSRSSRRPYRWAVAISGRDPPLRARAARPRPGSVAEGRARDGWGLSRLASPLRRTLNLASENAVLNSIGIPAGWPVALPARRPRVVRARRLGGGENRRREGGSCRLVLVTPLGLGLPRGPAPQTCVCRGFLTVMSSLW